MKTLIFSLLALGLSTSSLAAEMMAPKDEAQFLDMMSEHHTDGIKMAEMAEKKAQSDDVRALAKKIATEQKSETEKMMNWRKQWYPGEKASASAPKMDMNALQQASGKDFDKEFLSMMSKHHQDGVVMFNSAMPVLKHKETQSMAKKSVATQKSEIQQMQALKSTVQ